MKQDQESRNIGHQLDPEYEQDVLECQGEDDLLHPDFVHVNPDDLELEANDIGDNLHQVKKTLKNVEIKTSDEILDAARQLDEFQKTVLHVGIKFAQDLIIAKKGKLPFPIAPLQMVHGGAGSGKSTVINVMCQYIHHILRKEGDDPDRPYVVLSAYTGGAASNIDGQ